MVKLRSQSQRDTGEMVPPDVAAFEFYRFLSYGISWEKLVLPDKFASELSGRELREMKLRVAGGGGRRAWDVEVNDNEYGDMYLGRGWREFAGANGLELGQLLVFRYDGAALLSVTVFEESECRRPYQQQEEEEEEQELTASVVELKEGNSPPATPARAPTGSGSSRRGTAEAGTDPESSQFSVMLRKCHLGQYRQQYLNVHAYFHEAHGYVQRSKVVLQMRGESWTVTLKHSRGGKRTEFRYGWHQFCLDNGLGLGDTCFFHALPEGCGRRGEDHAVLRVEVRKHEGTILP
ncbi:B3 domain-containing protein Os03g0212300-like [Lolium rigidum]|uniref:B3 domain-containing protein Os03g0212300-like n=1 Tax=Lolium rigidum TaxID=89674 RepID=UPI001F5D4D59|nr:B3 domain-containing protein Os03g0212300-like [Lolium rigidum]